MIAAETIPSSSLFYVGMGLWLIGEFINGYHHLLLSRLRREGDTRYYVPRGGLFTFVTCPHYFGEMLFLWGWAIMMRHLAMYVGALGMTMLMAGRALQTTKWYLEKMPEEYPRDRKHVIPFVF